MQAEWAEASLDIRCREDPSDLRWFHFIRLRQIYAWQYEGQPGHGVVDTTDHTIGDVIMAL